MSSARFPGKVLMELAGVPLIVFMLQRLQQAQRLTGLLLATSQDASDDILVTTVRQHGFEVFRGSLDDVLDRYCQAAQKYRADVIVRVTGDCPLMDPGLVDMMVARQQELQVDYCSNACPPTFPDGLDVEVMTYAALERAWREATLASEREHVTAYMRKHPGKFSSYNVEEQPDMSRLRWTVDYPDDLEMVKALLSGMDVDRQILASRFDFYAQLEQRPDIRGTPAHPRDEGYRLSLQRDRELEPRAFSKGD